MKKLTGRTRFRAAEIVGLGLVPQPALVWQVQTETFELSPSGNMALSKLEWRDAQVEDLCEINHVVYSTINVNVEIPTRETLPGEEPIDARKLH